MTSNELDAAYSRGIADWEGSFLNRCKEDQAARKAWSLLKAGGLDAVCRKLLWEYATCQKDFVDVQRGVALIIHNVRDFRRAQRVETNRSGDPRAQLFRQRREAAERILAQTPWPFRNPRIPTFGDAARIYRSPGLFDLRKLRALMNRSGLKYLLAILREGAKAHAVILSANDVAALATCADPDRPIDERSMRRFLKEPWVQTAEPGYRSLFKSLIKPAQ